MPRSLGLTRVAVVEDHQLFAESLDVALTLEGHDVHRVELPHDGGGAGWLLAAVLRTRARVVLLDLDLGSAGSGLRLIQPLVSSGAAVVVVTSVVDRARWGECLGYGARTVLPKSASLNTILATIRQIGEGRAVLTRELRESLVASFHEEKQEFRDLRARLDSLTRREADVLGNLMAGLAVRDIARSSVVSEATVRTQVKAILAKLAVSSQLAAVGAAHRARWTPPSHRSTAEADPRQPRGDTRLRGEVRTS